MANKASLVERVYHNIKRDISDGTLLPAERVDISALCKKFGASPSPIRNALNRLVGEGLLEVHSHDGFYRPRLTEARLRDQYVFSQNILTLAIDMAVAQSGETPDLPRLPSTDDIVLETEILFDAIAELSDNGEVRKAVRSINDRLRPISLRTGTALIKRDEEIQKFRATWERHDLSTLRELVIAYHATRLSVIAQIVSFAYQDESNRH